MSSNKSGRGLGRGFDSLIPTDFDAAIIAEDEHRIKNVSTAKLKRNIDQPRNTFDDQELAGLADSIKRHGILQPLVVMPGTKSGTYVIVAGERRWRAAQLASLTEVPVIVRTTKELEKLEIGLIENVQRVDLSPLEQAASIARLHTEFNVGYDEIAKRIGKAPSTIQNTVRLLQLPPAAQKALASQKISEGHARAILALKSDPERQQALLDLILKNGWSVRQAENFVGAYKQGAKDTQAAKKRTSEETPLTKKLTRTLDTKVTVKHLAKGGQLLIRFTSDDELERIIKHLLK